MIGITVSCVARFSSSDTCGAPAMVGANYGGGVDGVAFDTSSLRFYHRQLSLALFYFLMEGPVPSLLMRLEFTYLHTGFLSDGGAVAV